MLRAIDVAEIPELRISAKSSDTDMVDAIVDNLIGRGQSRPRKVKTLQNTISHLIKEELDDKALEALVEEMKKRKLITVKNSNVSYKLPDRARRRR